MLLKIPILAANKSLRIFNITKMAAKRSQRAMLNGQYWVFNKKFDVALPVTTTCTLFSDLGQTLDLNIDGHDN